MNYKRIYIELTNNCKSRGLDKKALKFLTEKHHILPKSLGGNDSKENLVLLTPREHFIAHKLLWYSDKSCVKMQRALKLMSNKGKLTSKQYDVLKNSIYQNSLGENNPFYGKKHTEESKAKWVKSREGWKPSRESIEKTRAANLGAKRSPEAVKNMSIAAKNKKLRPWQTSTVMVNPASQDIWIQADFYFDCWRNFDKPGERRFKTLYDFFFNDTISLGAFANMIRRFRDGWIPTQDEVWLIYKGGENA